ncbi:Ig-like domain-containing protein, partial [Listeria monocytogenes]|nr:Ig-like domain-containing protein [Listeria monocytogenes]
NITAGVLPSSAPQDVTFTSSDEAKATVDSDGVVTGVATTVTAIKITVASKVKPSVKNDVSVSVTSA